MISFKEYISKKLFQNFMLVLLVLIITINGIYMLFNYMFINDAKDHLNESLVANINHLLVEYDMDIQKLEKYIIHYTHTNHVEIGIRENNEFIIGTITNEETADSYKVYDYDIYIDRDTSILIELNNKYLIFINLISVFFFFLVLLLNRLLSTKVSKKLVNEIEDITNQIDTIIDGNYKEIGLSNIIEISKIDKTLKYLNNKLSELNIQRNILIDEITHEIKTPLTVIKMHIEGVVDEIYDINDSAEILTNEIDRINSLVQRINNLDREDKTNTKVNLSQILEESIKVFLPLFNQNQIKLEKEITKNIIYVGNKEHFKQIFTNILSNINKYCTGTKEVSIKLYKENNDVKIEFKNSSDDISREDIEQIFNRGFRAQNTNIQDGKGIGLSVVKTLIEYNKGKINFKNGNNETNIEIVL